MSIEKAPLYFEARLGMLKPANRAAEEAMRDIKGRVRVEVKGGIANQRRRGLYWVCAGVVVELLNQSHGLTLDETDLHDLTRDKLRMFDEIRLPSGDTLRKRHSTSNRAMNEAERAAFTDRALALWSTWAGVDVTTLRTEAERLAA
ncbi:hypothetical protein [Novosphingobium sp. MMS21-SN21R]|uniref:hypothetical protein n=1 Tax=Novosphingobium sp. MMS21-SN21R TaxID=2969298 RepID=UPI002884EC2B|nr:hypothetical protein [Novosphingobium sp. MMS21-SN21R]MDT0507498.1 hypothetical protein [Novosphingobium sp. MMS21-SN21R]MDT0509503.1 hypothetical protein [Novosphingobium sp. MMS21-SN21R]